MTRARVPATPEKKKNTRTKQILLVPSAFTVPTGKAHWEVLLRARAIEAQCYVVAAAQAGRHNEKRESYGHSLIVDPWGKVLADAGDASPSLITAEIGAGLCCCTCDWFSDGDSD